MRSVTPSSLRVLSKSALVRSALLEIGADENGTNAGQPGDRSDQLALPFHVAEPPDLGDERRIRRDRQLLAEPVRVG